MVAVFVVYELIIGKLFLSIVHRVGLVQLDENINTVFAFEASGILITNNYDSSSLKANTR